MLLLCHVPSGLNTLLRHLTPLTIGLGISLEPLVGSLIGWALGVAGAPGPFTLGGGAMVLAATIVVTFASGQREAAAATAADAANSSKVDIEEANENLGERGGVGYGRRHGDGRSMAEDGGGTGGGKDGRDGRNPGGTAADSVGVQRLGKGASSAMFSIDDENEDEQGLGNRHGLESSAWVKRCDVAKSGSAVEMGRLLSPGNSSDSLGITRAC